MLGMGCACACGLAELCPGAGETWAMESDTCSFSAPWGPSPCAHTPLVMGWWTWLWRGRWTPVLKSLLGLWREEFGTMAFQWYHVGTTLSASTWSFSSKGHVCLLPLHGGMLFTWSWKGVNLQSFVTYQEYEAHWRELKKKKKNN